MKNLNFVIIKQNWNMKGPGEWDNIMYKIYDDFSVDIIANYTPIINKEGIIKNTTIEEEDYKKLCELMEKIEDITETVNGCDGEAWKFIYYKNNEVYKIREAGYIYGIDILENIQTIIEKKLGHEIKEFKIEINN